MEKLNNKKLPSYKVYTIEIFFNVLNIKYQFAVAQVKFDKSHVLIKYAIVAKVLVFQELLKANELQHYEADVFKHL